MCKRCCVLLIPGVTCIVRTRKKREKHSVVTCLECGTVRRYVYKAAKIPWIDKADAWEDKIIFGKPVKDDSKGTEQQNKKGQGKGKNNKQGSSKTSKEKSESTEHSGKATNQWDLGNKIREPNKVDLNTGSSDIRNCQTLDCKSACKKRQLDGEISIIGNKTDFKKHCELGKLSEKFNSAAQKTTNSSIDEESYLAHCSGTSVKTDMESSQNPAEAVEETEQRPDEYLYKMTFVHGFYPYLG